MRRTSEVAVAVLGSFATLACSLMRLGEFDAPPCTSNADCASAIRARGHDPERCSPYVCNRVSGFCEPADADGDERCYGRDNNCDGYVDEDVVTTPVALERATDKKTWEVRYALGPGGVTYVVTGFPGDHPMISTIGGTEPADNLSYVFPGASEAARDSSLRCPDPNPEEPGAVIDTPCNIADASLSATRSSLVFANVNTVGRACGQLRVGISPKNTPGEISLGPSEEPEALQNPCTASQPGVSFPAVASVEVSERAQALAVWLATDIRRLTCSDENPCPVRALGVFESAASSDGLQAAGSEIDLGASRHASAPAVVAVSLVDAPPEYLVAFAGSHDESAGVLIHRVEAGDLSREAVISRGSLLLPLTDVGKASFSLPSLSGNRFSVGLAWNYSDAPGSGLGFTVVSSKPNEPLSSSELVPVETGNVVRGPEVVRVESGFSVDAPEGGWLIFWEESMIDGHPRLLMARIAERQLKLLGTRVLAEGPGGTLPAWFPRLLNDSEVEYGVVDETEPNQNQGSPLLRSAACVDRD